MSQDQKKEESDLGKRIRLHIAGENYYLLGVRTPDGGMDFHITVPDQNKPTGRNRWITAEEICKGCAALTRMVD